MKELVQLCVALLLVSCSGSRIATREEGPPQWRQISERLYMDTNGNLGFATEPEIAGIQRTALEGERCANVFLTHLGSDGKQSLRSVIDTATFVELGASFFKDKHSIYHYYAMCEGGYLRIFSKDTSNFRVLNTCYVQHDTVIYHSRNGRLDADYESFVPSEKFGCVAKDQSGYFRYEERVTREALISEMGIENFTKLEEELNLKK